MRNVVTGWGAALVGAFVFAAPALAGQFTLFSPSVPDGGTLPMAQVYNKFGCTGGDRSPALQWSGAPAGTRGFAITVYDPDAPTGSGWWHWVVVNIPSYVHALPAGVAAGADAKLPRGAVQARDDYGISGFGGACPPKGDKPHHYIFTVYALKTAHLPVTKMTTGAMAGYFIHGNMLAKASITATYGRP
jgi:Raf kinase inhibitor-like YbhB/YbcL family protein